VAGVFSVVLADWCFVCCADVAQTFDSQAGGSEEFDAHVQDWHVYPNAEGWGVEGSSRGQEGAVRRGRRPATEAERRARRYPCKTCGRQYKQATSLWRHRQKCDNRFSMSCSFCEQIFHRKDLFRLHLFNKHDYVDPVLGPPGAAVSQRGTHPHMQVLPESAESASDSELHEQGEGE
jgi:hypothetical protein